MHIKIKKSYIFAEAGNECLAEAYRILHCYIRFMFIKCKLGNFNIDVFQYCPHFTSYAYHLTAAISIAREASLNNEIEIFYPSSKCQEIDLLLKRFIFKNYKINLIYKKNFKQTRNNFYKPFKINFLKSLKGIIFDLRVFQNKDFKLSNDINKPFDILLLTHPFKRLENIDPYNYLTKKLINFFNRKDLLARNIIPSQLGLNIFEKLSYSCSILFKILSILSDYKYISYSNINFIILTINRKKYKEKLKSFFLNKKIKFIVASYIDMKYEPIYYEAARELGIKYFLYDFSVGYPLRDCKYIRYMPDVRKYADVVFFNSIFRMEQYKKAVSYKDINIKFLPHPCPQIEFSDYGRNTNFLQKKEIIIAIVDNMFFDDLNINHEDVYSLSKEFKKLDFNFELILQSKRGELCEIFNKFKIKYVYKNLQKGDLSALRKADIILSLGWQGTSLKAAFQFNKPIIFYSKNGYPYKESFFSFNRDKNYEINKLCSSLWFEKKTFNDNIVKLTQDKKFFNSIKKKSSRLIELVGFVDGKLDKYFEKYLY